MNQAKNSLGKLFIGSFLLFAIAPVFPSTAQITPDSTLGTESSRLDTNVLINNVTGDKINGGAIRDSNLFHSFSEFNINDGQRVYFSNPSGVLNILTRVTGGNRSSILGTLGVDGNANLFLINPNGILFGKNASLDVRGSFVGTTANGVQFGNQGVFSATNPQAAPLLTVNPSALVFSQVQANAGITNLSQAPAGVNPEGNNTRGLRVPDGKSLLLVGGNINVDESGLRAYDGRVELTGLAAPGNIGLNVTGDILSLNIPKDVTLADVFLSNESGISVFGAVGGNIAINARNIDINSSSLFAGIAKGKGNPTTQAGDINLNATGNIVLANSSVIDNSISGNGNAGNVFVRANGAVTLESGDIFSTIEAGGIGNAGNINIQADSLTLTDSAQLLTAIRAGTENLPAGRGNAGDVNINVRGAVTFANPQPGIINGIASQVDTGAIGNGGDITINAGSLDITGGSEIQGSTSGKGNAGNITINVRDRIRFDGRGETGSFSRAIASVQPGAEGNAGNINITTDSLKLTNGAFLSSSTLGKGDAANIIINARDISFDTNSQASSSIFTTGIGKGGEIRITTNFLSLTNGSGISSDVSGQGNAGNIFIDARDSVKIDGVLVDAGKFLNLDNLDFDSWSTISSILVSEGVGKSGNIQITTPSLFLTNGGRISSYSNGQGNAGNITINAPNNVTIAGFAGRENFNSEVSSFVSSNSVGDGGEIRINTGTLAVKNGGGIGANNGGVGNGGNIFLDASDTITFDGFGANGLPSQAATFAVNGNAGNVQIKTGSLFLTNGGYISSLLFNGKGNAGNIVINARDTIKIDGVAKTGDIKLPSSLTSALLSAEGRGGDIEITTGSLSVTNGGNIFSGSNGRGNAGSITMNARDIVTFDGGVNGFIANAGSAALDNSTGNGGDISINARGLFLKNGASLAAFSSGSGSAGNIFINTLDTVTFDGSAGDNLPSQATTFAIGGGNGGNIQLKTGTLTLTNGGQFSTFANRNAGNVDINARNVVIIDGVAGNNQSGVFTILRPGGVGKGGDIQVTTNSLTLSNTAQLATATLGQGNAGNIKINAFGDITLKNGSTINASTLGQGNAGDITINAGGKFFLEGTTTNGLKFDTGVFTIVGADSGFTGKGKGGNINVTSRDLSLNRAAISASSLGEGTGGNVDIKAGTVRLDNKSAIASVTNSGNGGNIFLDIQDFLVLRNSSNISTTAGLQQAGGDGGNITINIPFIVAVPNENSDITANAFTGNGGNINITTQGIFGIQPRAQASDATNDITASSQLGVQGQIAITNPEIDPTKGIIELPNDVVDATTQLSQLCPRGYDAFRKPLSEFIITGHDALPPSPLNPLQGTARIPLATWDGGGQENTFSPIPYSPLPHTPQIIEAQGLVKNSQGEVFLVAQAPQTTPSSQPKVSPCPQVSEK